MFENKRIKVLEKQIEELTSILVDKGIISKDALYWAGRSDKIHHYKQVAHRALKFYKENKDSLSEWYFYHPTQKWVLGFDALMKEAIPGKIAVYYRYRGDEANEKLLEIETEFRNSPCQWSTVDGIIEKLEDILKQWNQSGLTHLTVSEVDELDRVSIKIEDILMELKRSEEMEASINLKRFSQILSDDRIEKCKIRDDKCTYLAGKEYCSGDGGYFKYYIYMLLEDNVIWSHAVLGHYTSTNKIYKDGKELSKKETQLFLCGEDSKEFKDDYKKLKNKIWDLL